MIQSFADGTTADIFWERNTKAARQIPKDLWRIVQRKLKIGYNRSARILEQMEAEGIVGPQEGTKPREIFVRPPEE